MNPDEREKKYVAETETAINLDNAANVDRVATEAKLGRRTDREAQLKRATDRERDYWRRTLASVYLR